MAEFKRISVGGVASDPAMDRIRAGISVGKSSVPKPGEGEVLISDGTATQGMPGVSPVIPEQQQIPQEKPIDPMEFFQRTSPVQETLMTRNMQDAWWNQFAREFQKQRFTSLDEYVNFAAKLKDSNGNTVAFEEILPYIQKQALEYMPPQLKQELEAKKQEIAADAQFKKTLAKLDEMNSNPEMKARGISYVLNKHGQPEAKMTDPNADFERKYKLAELAKKRLDALESMGGVVPGKDASAEEKLQFKMKQGELQGSIMKAQEDYRRLLDNAFGEDKATAQGNPGGGSVGSMLDKDSFIQDFIREEGRNPTSDEILALYGKAWR